MGGRLGSQARLGPFESANETTNDARYSVEPIVLTTRGFCGKIIATEARGSVVYRAMQRKSIGSADGNLTWQDIAKLSLLDCVDESGNDNRADVAVLSISLRLGLILFKTRDVFVFMLNERMP